MRTIRIIQHFSLDGVIQSPGAPDEDRDGNFPSGGWTIPLSDPAVREAVAAAHGKSLDLLLGRHTYDIWAGYWPKQRGPIADTFNAATKYVATHRPESLAWGPAHALRAGGAGGDDIAADIRRIKSQSGPHLIVWGSSTLTPVLLGNQLADELVLLTYPVLLGTGKRLFSDVAGPPMPRELALVSTRAASSGIIISTYRPAGPLRTGSFTKPNA